MTLYKATALLCFILAALALLGASNAEAHDLEWEYRCKEITHVDYWEKLCRIPNTHESRWVLECRWDTHFDDWETVCAPDMMPKEDPK